MSEQQTPDREKKIAEIRKSVEEARKTKGSWVDGQDYADDVKFLLDELERETKTADDLRDNAEAWQRKAERLGKERNKLIEVLRWYADEIKYMNWPSELWINQGQRAREILEEIGVTVK